ncbi:hypothetical protein AB0383_16425 [Amycolatopsis sp. NPDC051373]
MTTVETNLYCVTVTRAGHVTLRFGDVHQTEGRNPGTAISC